MTARHLLSGLSCLFTFLTWNPSTPRSPAVGQGLLSPGKLLCPRPPITVSLCQARQWAVQVAAAGWGKSHPVLGYFQREKTVPLKTML